MSESFEFDVVSDHRAFSVQYCIFLCDSQAYSTSFEKIEQLRELMLAFLKSERRDYLPTFDVVVLGIYIYLLRSMILRLIMISVDIPEQEKMTLKADIKYKSNWQQAALKGVFHCSA